MRPDGPNSTGCRKMNERVYTLQLSRGVRLVLPRRKKERRRWKKWWKGTRIPPRRLLPSLSFCRLASGRIKVVRGPTYHSFGGLPEIVTNFW